MKEITRIHIAKQAYDIETTAKKELEAYMRTLEHYAGEAEILEDIEIRITELLAEAGVDKGGVITANEVAAVRATLGEPEEFASEGVSVAQDKVSDQPVRRLFRNREGAILGGVLNGIASFFGVDVVWVRLAFVVLLFASFGAAFLVYILLWVVIPPAHTAADRLQMVGRPVTLAALREQATTVMPSTRGAEILKSLLFIGGGIIAVTVAVMAILITLGVLGVLIISADMKAFIIGLSSYAWMAWMAIGLFVLSGLLLSLLASLVAIMLFKRRTTKRMTIAVIVIVISGILSASAGGALMAGGFQLRAHEAQSLTKTYEQPLPEMTGVTKLVAQAYSASGSTYGHADEMTIKYVVTTGAPRYELRTQFNSKPSVSVQGDTVRISLKSVGSRVFEYGYTQPELVIYGPALKSVEVAQGSVQYYSLEGQVQGALQATTLGTTRLSVFGSYDKLSIQGGGRVDVSMSTVRNLLVDMQGGMTSIEAGVVYSLSVNYPDVCPIQSADDQRPTVSVRSVASGEVVYNGIVEPVVQRTTPCGAVIIGTQGEGDLYEN